MNARKFTRALRGTQIVGSDWPFSLGFTIHVMTDNVDADAGHRKSADLIREFISETASPEHAGSSGYSLQFDNSRQYVVIIMSTEADVRVSDGRMIELIAHECSHIVDYVSKQTCMTPCTETRAYTLDWLVGKVTQVVLPHLWAPKLLEAPK